MAAYDRQHGGPGAQQGRWRKRGTHKEGFGRSRGGFTSKIHARADGQGRPLGFELTGGEVSDYTEADALMALPVAIPQGLLADKGYDSDSIREGLFFHGVLPVIPPRSNRTQHIPCDFRRYRDRNRIERMFNRLKQFRRIATRYDKTRKSFLPFLNLAAVKLWLPSFVNRA
ncbi:MAG: IS5 family transposase [Acetobacter sp.]|uniref:IS5 family transposase n=1 Tax=Acetobacter sp. TaxID=440 RepID=UPI0039E9E58E